MKLLTLALVGAFALTPALAPTGALADRGGCPPGLAKKHNGCTPPGLARRDHRDHHDDRRVYRERRHDDRRDWREHRRDDYRDTRRDEWRDERRDAPRDGYRLQRAPTGYWNGGGEIVLDWSRYGLPQPPSRHLYFRNGNTFYLVESNSKNVVNAYTISR
ncbi:RcnB family protein [Oceaniglobus roseus]|uniref:RcnB family protein n=1 Tax=Oceaniglobus roseus TaxID=1737570 RepID=UPI000C7F207B|nr:RcnB family protein [Kandeliimicrobium roseum]